jgi:hypothetical protein
MNAQLVGYWLRANQSESMIRRPKERGRRMNKMAA